MMSNFTEKFRSVWNVVAPSLMVLLIVASFALSVAALTKSVKTDQKVNALAASFEKSMTEMSMTLDAMNGHLAFLENYLGDHANFFYGNERITIDASNNVKNRKK